MPFPASVALRAGVLLGLAAATGAPGAAWDRMAADGPQSSGPGARTSSRPNPGHPLTLTGSVTAPLLPGTPATLAVTVTNGNNQPVVITSVTGEITSVTTAGLPGIPACSAQWFSIGRFTGSQYVPRSASTVVPVPIALADLPATNQDNCKGVTVRLRFTAEARQA